jgi:CysZ protein
VLTVALLIALAAASGWIVGTLLGHQASQVRVTAEAVAVVLALFLGYLIYLPLARVLLAPFSEALSRKTFSFLCVGKTPATRLVWTRAMVEGLKMVALQIVIWIVVVSVGILIPPIGAGVGLAAAVFFAGLSFLDIPLSVKGYTMKEKLKHLTSRPGVTIGFGLATYLLLFIPVLNVLALPIGVVGATKLISEE